MATTVLTLVASQATAPIRFNPGVSSRSDCPPRVEFEAQVELASQDQLLSEEFRVKLRVTEDQVAGFQFRVPLSELQGKYDASEFTFGPDPAKIELLFVGEFSGGRSTGRLDVRSLSDTTRTPGAAAEW